MPTYEYKTPSGRTFEIVAPMSNIPPAEILVFPDGTWQDAAAEITGKYDNPKTGQTGLYRARYIQGLHPRDRIFERQLTGGAGFIITDLAVRPDGKGLPVSKAAPRLKGGKRRKVGDHVIREHDCGTITNDKGQPVVDSNRAAREVAKRTGMDID